MKAVFVTKALVAAVFAAISASSFAANEVQNVASGTWSDALVTTGNGFGYEKKNLWVDVKVQNLAYQKIVGIRWSDDNWATYTNSPATYEMTYSDGSERWGVDLTPVGQVDYTRFADPAWTSLTGAQQTITATGIQVKYAIYYTVNGVTYWDNASGQNYSVTVATQP